MISSRTSSGNIVLLIISVFIVEVLTLTYAEGPRNISVVVEKIPHNSFAVENIQHVTETKEGISKILLAARSGRISKE